MLKVGSDMGDFVILDNACNIAHQLITHNFFIVNFVEMKCMFELFCNLLWGRSLAYIV